MTRFVRERSRHHAASIDVRRATVDDIDDASELFDAYRGFYGQPSDLAAARSFLLDRAAKGDSVVLLALHQSTGTGAIRAVGFAQLYPSLSSISLGATIVLNDLYVVPRARRLGVASRLVEATVEHALSVRARYIELLTHRGNAAALGLYREKGFVADTEFERLTLPL